MTRKKFINAKLKGYDELQEILVEDGVFKKIAPSIEVEGGCEMRGSWRKAYITTICRPTYSP